MVSIDVLRQCELFADLNDEELGKIAQICHEETHGPQEVIFGESEVAEKVYILQEGQVAVQMHLRSDLEPNGDVIIEEVTPGRIFGWSALVRQRRFTASVRALEKVRVIAIKSTDLNALFEENSHIGFVVMKRLADVISSRLRRTRQQLGEGGNSNAS
jgi:CRP/FNR family cyclic AMP-dependent transcriptional regulator